MIKAVIFDCFGVLTTEGWLPFKQKYFSENAELQAEASEMRKYVDSGLASHNEFTRIIAEMAGVAEDEVRVAIEQNAPNAELFDYILASLKPKYKIGLLSNAGSNRLYELFQTEHVRMFDDIALSFETGVTKPDVRAYELIARKLGVEPAECIFVDDQERYCTGAQDCGMQAVLYHDFDQFRQDLEALLAQLA